MGARETPESVYAPRRGAATRQPPRRAARHGPGPGPRRDPGADADPAAQTKRALGQYFTTANPFEHPAFARWAREIPAGASVAEPFAGSGNLIAMARAVGLANPWVACDIAPVDPGASAAPDVPVARRDTLADFPAGHAAAITNPPYLAKNSASRRKLPYGGGDYDDVYKRALAVMLAGCERVAAIVPESFLTAGLFHDRLDAVVSLPQPMFDDTETPACLALFGPRRGPIAGAAAGPGAPGAAGSAAPGDFEVWSGPRLVGGFGALRATLETPAARWPWRFNDPAGVIALHAADTGRGADIGFALAPEAPSPEIKVSSRTHTRIGVPLLGREEAAEVAAEANRLLASRREQTSDVFMTAHFGLRADGRFRRRLDFGQARDLLDLARAAVAQRRKGGGGESARRPAPDDLAGGGA